MDTEIIIGMSDTRFYYIKLIDGARFKTVEYEFEKLRNAKILESYVNTNKVIHAVR